MEELKDLFRKVMNSPYIDRFFKTKAIEAFKQADNGVVPSLKTISLLRSALKPPSPCYYLQDDFTCIWLKENYQTEGLPPPGFHDTVVCNKRASEQRSCKGYRSLDIT